MGVRHTAQAIVSWIGNAVSMIGQFVLFLPVQWLQRSVRTTEHLYMWWAQPQLARLQAAFPSADEAHAPWWSTWLQRFGVWIVVLSIPCLLFANVMANTWFFTIIMSATSALLVGLVLVPALTVATAVLLFACSAPLQLLVTPALGLYQLLTGLSQSFWHLCRRISGGAKLPVTEPSNEYSLLEEEAPVYSAAADARPLKWWQQWAQVLVLPRDTLWPDTGQSAVWHVLTANRTDLAASLEHRTGKHTVDNNQMAGIVLRSTLEVFLAKKERSNGVALTLKDLGHKNIVLWVPDAHSHIATLQAEISHWLDALPKDTVLVTFNYRGVGFSRGFARGISDYCSDTQAVYEALCQQTPHAIAVFGRRFGAGCTEHLVASDRVSTQRFILPHPTESAGMAIPTGQLAQLFPTQPAQYAQLVTRIAGTGIFKAASALWGNGPLHNPLNPSPVAPPSEPLRVAGGADRRVAASSPAPSVSLRIWDHSPDADCIFPYELPSEEKTPEDAVVIQLDEREGIQLEAQERREGECPAPAGQILWGRATRGVQSLVRTVGKLAHEPTLREEWEASLNRRRRSANTP